MNKSRSQRGRFAGKKVVRQPKRNQVQKRQSRRQRGRPQGNGGSSVTAYSTPLNTAIVHRDSLMPAWRFGAAAPHSEYPEGGLRITGTLPTSNTAFIHDTVLLGLWGSSGLAAAHLCPTGAVTTGTTEPLFAATSSLAIFSQYFRKYRFRKFAVEWNSQVPPAQAAAAGVTGASNLVQFSYEHDPVTAEQLSGSYNLNTSVQSVNNTRFPVWTPSVMCPIVNDRKGSFDDPLYNMTTAGDSIATAGDAEMREIFQGSILATIGAVISTTEAVCGTGLLHFEIDLYGFANSVIGVLPFDARIHEREMRRAAATEVDDSDGELLTQNDVKRNLSTKSSKK